MGILRNLLSESAYSLLRALYLENGRIEWHDRERTRPMWVLGRDGGGAAWLIPESTVEKLERDGWLTDKLLLSRAGRQLLMAEFGNVDKLVAAIQVAVLDRNHRAWMEVVDPQCLAQMQLALIDNGVEVS